MSGIIEQYKAIWGDDPRQLLDGYTYQPVLTRKLDALDPAALNAELFYEIVLWKLNRFPHVDPALLAELREVAKIAPGHHEQARPVLRRLLQTEGIALPMASTILRFLNPQAFQIIDDRVYRVIFPDRHKYPAKPAKLNERYLDKSATIYFEYLDELHKHASDKLPFSEADRILYLLDIKLDNKIGGKPKPRPQ
ncbi:hypothetical protein FHW58_001878 [Duganella sp. 1224]|uniref:hypothetical protein n=1 Tax=Duganella sp. 1224 TaxID=2587052 RepID=UPI0015CC2ED1|nr:hypothetical protein [Duganella sp. 1224]NYE60726.1 hypothetical protein [Duganella sp. 1224]